MEAFLQLMRQMRKGVSLLSMAIIEQRRQHVLAFEKSQLMCEMSVLKRLINLYEKLQMR